MGQAKLRGTRDDRVAKAKQRIETLKPDHIVCNNCQANLTEIDILDTRGITGIEAAFSAHCTTCSNDTFAVKGDPDAVADIHLFLEMKTGSEVKMGIVPAAK